MFNFFKKFKQVQGEPDNEKEKSASPATPARHRSVKKVEELEPDTSLRRTERSEHMPDHTMRPEELVIPVPDYTSMPQQHHSNEGLEKVSTLEKQVHDLENDKRSLVNQEAKFQEQLAELAAQLTARDTEANKLLYQMEDLQRDVLIKSSGVDRLQAELDAAHKESECVRRRLRQLEDDLNSFKQQNRELQDELEKRAQELESEASSSEESNSERVQELESKVEELQQKLQEQEKKVLEQEQKVQEQEQKMQEQDKKVEQLQKQVEEIRKERDSLQKQLQQMEKERDEEMKIVQMALEDALEEKALVKCQFERDFEKLRTVNTDREQQLLDDFEWKLREVEQACKRRLEEKDKNVEQQKKDLEMKLKLAQQQLAELPHLRTFEAEVKQLRGLTLEQQRSLRLTSRQAEQFKVSEGLLKEEVTRLKGQLDKERSRYVCMDSLNDKKMVDAEKAFKDRLDKQKSDICAQWEERLRRECARLKVEYDKLHKEEKHLAVETVKVQKDQELCKAKQEWECRVDNFLKEISALKESLVEKDKYYQQELEKAQTNSDRDIFDLRRKLDKIDLSYQEQMENMNEKHEKEIEQLNWESERKIQQLEQNWQLQMSSTRATLELVKEQMERDAQDRIEALKEQHHRELDMQWERLTNEKEELMTQLKEKLQTESPKETELLETITSLKKQLQSQNGVISDLQNNVDLLQGGMQVLNQEVSTHNQDMQRVQTQAAVKIRELETEQRKKLSELKERNAAESKQWQEQTKTMRDQFQNKMNYLIKLLRDTDKKFRNRESRKEDIQLITKLKEDLQERDHKILSLTKEKQFCELELKNHHHSPRKKEKRWSSCILIPSSVSVEPNELVKCESENQRHCEMSSNSSEPPKGSFSSTSTAV